MAQHRTRSDTDADALLPGPAAPPSALRHDDAPPEPLDPDHRGAVLDGLDEVRRGEFASDADLAAIYRRAGL